MITLSIGAAIGFAALLFILGAAVGASVDAGVSRWIETEQDPPPDPPEIFRTNEVAYRLEAAIFAPFTAAEITDASSWDDVLTFVSNHDGDGLEIFATPDALHGTILSCPVGCRLRITDDVAVAADPGQVRALELRLGGFPR